MLSIVLFFKYIADTWFSALCVSFCLHVAVTLLLEQLHDAHFQGVFVEV